MHTRQVVPLLVTMALIGLAPAGSAGTAEEPEISDAPDDSSHPDETHDIVAVWIEDEPTDIDGQPHLAIHLQTPGAFTQHLPAFFATHESYRLGMVPTNPDGLSEGAADAYLSFRPSVDTDTGASTLACRFGFSPEAEGYGPLEEERAMPSEFGDGRFTCFLPTHFFGGFDTAQGHQLTNLYMLHHLIARGPLSGGDDIDPTEVEQFDRAPDDGFGTPYGSGNITAPGGNGTDGGDGNGTDNGTTDGNGTAPDLVVGNDTAIDSGNILAGETYAIRFDVAGAMAYHDHHNPSTQGEVTVHAAENGTEATTHTVRIVEGEGNDTDSWAFDPADLMISAGDTVEWVNEGENAHTVMGSFSTSGEADPHGGHGDHDMEGNHTDDGDEDTPGPAAALVLPALATAALLWRRRGRD